MSRQRAFTLIELLVVIAIIALLVSILMPSLHKAKRMGNSVACASNLRTITMAILTYASDNNDYAVPGMIGEPRQFWTHPDAFFVKGFLGSEDVLRCPSSGPPFEFSRDWSKHIDRNSTPSPNRWQEDPRWAGGAFYDYATTVEYCTPKPPDPSEGE
ncbi:MAG: type II secretion system GspH family protein [Phycisphaerae bacterium]|nr:type II secretion system GspH family protein [Phycisphaerae bacterium]